jgi:hypothetical protein
MTFGKHRPLVAVAGKREHAELKVVADVNRPIATL